MLRSSNLGMAIAVGLATAGRSISDDHSILETPKIPPRKRVLVAEEIQELTPAQPQGQCEKARRLRQITQAKARTEKSVK